MRKKDIISMKKVQPVLVLLVLALAACTPAYQPAETAVPPSMEEASVTPDSEGMAGAPETTPTAVQMVVTPRGPDLEASDPASASLATGDLQLVEFFRFT